MPGSRHEQREEINEMDANRSMVTETSTEGGITIPRIISVDDHVIEPPELWFDRLSAKYRNNGPRVERTKASHGKWEHGELVFTEDPDDPDGMDADIWVYEDTRFLIKHGYAAVGT